MYGISGAFFPTAKRTRELFKQLDYSTGELLHKSQKNQSSTSLAGVIPHFVSEMRTMLRLSINKGDCLSMDVNEDVEFCKIERVIRIVEDFNPDRGVVLLQVTVRDLVTQELKDMNLEVALIPFVLWGDGLTAQFRRTVFFIRLVDYMHRHLFVNGCSGAIHILDMLIMGENHLRDTTFTVAATGTNADDPGLSMSRRVMMQIEKVESTLMIMKPGWYRQQHEKDPDNANFKDLDCLDGRVRRAHGFQLRYFCADGAALVKWLGKKGGHGPKSMPSFHDHLQWQHFPAVVENPDIPGLPCMPFVTVDMWLKLYIEQEALQNSLYNLVCGYLGQKGQSARDRWLANRAHSDQQQNDAIDARAALLLLSIKAASHAGGSYSGLSALLHGKSQSTHGNIKDNVLADIESLSVFECKGMAKIPFFFQDHPDLLCSSDPGTKVKLSYWCRLEVLEDDDSGIKSLQQLRSTGVLVVFRQLHSAWKKGVDVINVVFATVRLWQKGRQDGSNNSADVEKAQGFLDGVIKRSPVRKSWLEEKDLGSVYTGVSYTPEYP